MGEYEYVREALAGHRAYEAAAKLRPGHVLHRWLRDGDWIVLNRQPTLHRFGIMVRGAPAGCR